MTLEGFTERVQALFPLKFEDTLMEDDDNKTIPNLIRQAYEKALSKFEKIENIEIYNSQSLLRASSLVKWIPALATTGARRYPTVWDLMGVASIRPYKVRVYFTPDRKILVEPDGTPIYIEYVVDPLYLSIEDLTFQYIQWAIKYAVALLKEKEGYLGTMAKLEALNIETNYEGMRGEGQTERDTLDEDLNDMYAGTLAIRVN